MGEKSEDRNPEPESPPFGERLRRERESRNITLQEMSESTKISQHCFKLLEDDDFASLPGGGDSGSGP